MYLLRASTFFCRNHYLPQDAYRPFSNWEVTQAITKTKADASLLQQSSIRLGLCLSLQTFPKAPQSRGVLKLLLT